jgi:hypothetical protein
MQLPRRVAVHDGRLAAGEAPRAARALDGLVVAGAAVLVLRAPALQLTRDVLLALREVAEPISSTSAA